MTPEEMERINVEVAKDLSSWKKELETLRAENEALKAENKRLIGYEEMVENFKKIQLEAFQNSLSVGLPIAVYKKNKCDEIVRKIEANKSVYSTGEKIFNDFNAGQQEAIDIVKLVLGGEG